MFSLFTSHSFAVSFEKNCKVPKGSIKIINIDGENLGTTPIDIKVLPSAIKIFN